MRSEESTVGIKRKIEQQEQSSLFHRDRHIQYFVHCLKRLPKEYAHFDTNRLTLVHFAVHSLDILGFFDDKYDNDNKDGDNKKKIMSLEQKYNVNRYHIIDWIYSLQIVSPSFCERRRRMQKRRADTYPKAASSISSKPDNEVFTENNGTNEELRMNIVKETCRKNYKVVNGGFQGGTFLNMMRVDNSSSSIVHREQSQNQNKNRKSKNHFYKKGHLAMTYTALCTLLALGDDLSNIDKESIIDSMKTLQQSDGSFQCMNMMKTEELSSPYEQDLRFLYCSCAISYILNDWSGLNKRKAIEYIRSCQSFDGAYGLIPGQESHGGSTFCAVASLALMGEIENELATNNVNGGHENTNNCTSSNKRDELVQWCVSRQIRGMQGRPNKHEDTCYSYWLGATLVLLGCDHLLDKNALQEFILSCQTDMGGFSKLGDANSIYPDLLHSFYSLAWLSLSTNSIHSTQKYQGNYSDSDECAKYLCLKQIHSSLGICCRYLME